MESLLRRSRDMSCGANRTSVEKWGLFEITMQTGQEFANPFVDVALSAEFTCAGGTKKVRGFHDGQGCWKLRFMPDAEGAYSFTTHSSLQEFNEQRGALLCTPASPGSHGPVHADGRHFRHADGTPFYMLGTTVYSWTVRPAEVRARTLASLARNRFNRVRMLFFPKHLMDTPGLDICHEPPNYPYEGGKNCFDFKRFSPRYFQDYEQRVAELGQLGMQADIILFHFYDFGMWGFDAMSDGEALFYLDYLLARLSAYQNVWWCLANEYDLLLDPETQQATLTTGRRDWEAIGRFIRERDPYRHPTSIHHWGGGQPHPDRDWLTHVSFQVHETYNTTLRLRLEYAKPIVADEFGYEGNVPGCWGDKTAQYALLLHWHTVFAGGYGTHAESYIIDGNTRDIFWTYGGDMVGQSAPRLGFLRDMAESLPFSEMEPDASAGDSKTMFCTRKGDDICLYMLTGDCAERTVVLGGSGKPGEYRVTVYDVWDCCELSHCVHPAGAYRVAQSGWVLVKAERIPDRRIACQTI